MKNSFEILKYDDKDSAAAALGENLNNLLLENKKNPVLLILSAGSSLNALNYVSKNALGENLTISMLDERFSLDPNINNFIQLQHLDFYNDALAMDVSFFGTLPRKGETREQLAERWENNLKTWLKEHKKGLVVATLGMGHDGHTAGMFPYPEAPDKFRQLFLGAKLATAYEADGKHQFPNRITTTAPFFKKIDIGLAYVCGLDKKQKFDQLRSNEGKIEELPALIWLEIKNLRIFTDLQ